MHSRNSLNAIKKKNWICLCFFALFLVSAEHLKQLALLLANMVINKPNVYE